MAKADFQRAREVHPSTEALATPTPTPECETAWVQVFHANPEIMWQILGDVFNVVLDERDRDDGIRRIGRRPVRAAGSIDELLNTVMPPQFNSDPFPAALKRLMGKRSQRQFAPRVPVTQTTLSRLLSGSLKPDLQVLEQVAAACKVPPYYFVEYRALFLGTAIQQVLTTNPNLGITAWKRYRAAERELPE